MCAIPVTSALICFLALQLKELDIVFRCFIRVALLELLNKFYITTTTPSIINGLK